MATHGARSWPGAVGSRIGRKTITAAAVTAVAGLASAADGQVATVGDPIQNPANGHWYVVLDRATLTPARQTAAAMGGYLVTINDAAENEWVRANLANLGGEPRRLWIGFTDEAQEGNWRWMNGEDVTYVNWLNNPVVTHPLLDIQPDNHTGRTPEGEQFCEMFLPESGQWNDDVDCCNVTKSAAVELDGPLGACCSGQSCAIKTAAACAPNGSFSGPGTACSLAVSGDPVAVGPRTPGTSIGPDAGTVTSDALTATGVPALVGSIELTLDISHTYIGDLEIELIHLASGRRVTVWDNHCFSGDGLSVTIVDGGAPRTCAGDGQPTVGTIAPSNPLSGFGGVTAGGDWMLQITDTAAGDAGTLNSWSMRITGGSYPSCGTPCRADFDGSGAVGVSDIFVFLSAWFAQEARADFDRSGAVQVADIFVFLSAWFAGC